MIVGERLRDVVVGALAQRLDRGLDTGVGGDDNAHHFGIELVHLAQQVKAAAAATQVEVEDREIDLFALEDAQGGVGGAGLENFVALAAQELHANRAHQLLVLDYEDAKGTILGLRPDLFGGLLFGIHWMLATASVSAMSANAGRQMVTAGPSPAVLSTPLVPRLF